MKKRRFHDVDSPRLSTEDDFRSLFELSAVGAAQVSPEGRYLRVNQKYCQMLGYSEQELLQRAVVDVTYPDDREESAVILSSSFSGEPEEYSIEKRYLRKDGGLCGRSSNGESCAINTANHSTRWLSLRTSRPAKEQKTL